MLCFCFCQSCVYTVLLRISCLFVVTSVTWCPGRAASCAACRVDKQGLCDLNSSLKVRTQSACQPYQFYSSVGSLKCLCVSIKQNIHINLADGAIVVSSVCPAVTVFRDCFLNKLSVPTIGGPHTTRGQAPLLTLSLLPLVTLTPPTFTEELNPAFPSKVGILRVRKSSPFLF